MGQTGSRYLRLHPMPKTSSLDPEVGPHLCACVHVSYVFAKFAAPVGGTGIPCPAAEPEEKRPRKWA